MSLRNLFRRDASSKAKTKGEPVLDVMRPWWAWGPLGLMWYGSHHTDTPADPGHISPHVDPGGFHNPQDFGGGFGGFDGGGGAI